MNTNRIILTAILIALSVACAWAGGPENTVVPISNGGTGQTSASAALYALAGFKVKEITFTTGPSTTATDATHGVDDAKIISATCFVTPSGSTSLFPPEYTIYSGFKYSFHISSGKVVVTPAATGSNSIFNSLVHIVLFYKE